MGPVPRAGRRSGLVDLARRVRQANTDDRVPLVAAGVAFYSFVALVPTVFVLLSVYGFVADPADVRHLVRDTLSAAPAEVRRLVLAQLNERLHATATSVSIRAIVGGLLAVWAASGAIARLIEAVSIAVDQEPRAEGFRLRILAVGATVVAAVGAAIAVGLVTVLPQVVPDSWQGVVGILRWPLLFAVLVVALVLLYKYAPAHPNPAQRVPSPGALVAAAVSVGASILMAVYSSHFARFHQTYGSLSTSVVTLLWLYLGAYAVVLGAEIDAEIGRSRTDPPRSGSLPPDGG